MSASTIVVAVDGPAGAGKSTVSREVARRCGFGYLDTGAAYRALTWLGLERGADPDDPAAIADLVAAFDYRPDTDPNGFRAFVGGTDVSRAIREPRVSGAVSGYSAQPPIREALIAAFRRIIATESRPGIVVEGRDITTVVAPDAEVRVLLTASPEARARRRAGQRRAGAPVTPEEIAEIAAAIRERDAKDSAVTDFLAPAPGVTLFDTSDLAFEQTVVALIELVEQAQAAQATRPAVDGGTGDRSVGDHLAERLSEIDDETARRTRDALRAGLDAYELDDEDAALLQDELDEAAPEAASRPAPPVVAVIGRPNVGKSTLVNRVIGSRQAIVEDVPGVTRDRASYSAEWAGREFTLVDTGGWAAKTAGIDRSVAEQAETAIAESDAVLFVVDGRVGSLDEDERLVSMLRRSGKPTVLAVNKIDDGRGAAELAEFWGLGLGEPHPVSGLHGLGSGDLLDALLAVLPKHSQVAALQPGGPRRVAIIGRPNVGKSSLLNQATGRRRAVVDDLAGTTRDPIDEVVEIAGTTWRFVDTAGIRRRSREQQGSDYYATLRTQTALDRCEVAIVVFDVTEEITDQDVKIVEMVLDAGRALVLAFNKWDLIDDETRARLEDDILVRLAHVAWAPRVNLSALTGRHLEKLVPALQAALAGWDTRIPTGKLNAFVRELAQEHPHPLRGGKQPRILFATQATTQPPTFVLFTSGFLDPGYRRYLVRRLREIYGFIGTPIRIGMRVRERRRR